MEWTLEKLKHLTVHERSNLYANASRLAHTPKGAALKATIEEVGLPFSVDACLTMDDPISVKMIDIIYSDDGKAAAIKGVQERQPAMLYLDPMLQEALGSDYGAHNMGTSTAGSIVGKLMMSMGYKKTGSKPLPSHCVAKTAATWKK